MLSNFCNAGNAAINLFSCRALFFGGTGDLRVQAIDGGNCSRNRLQNARPQAVKVKQGAAQHGDEQRVQDARQQGLPEEKEIYSPLLLLPPDRRTD